MSGLTQSLIESDITEQTSVALVTTRASGITVSGVSKRLYGADSK